MRLKKFLLLVFIITTCGIIYIHQQTQVLLVSYQLQKNQATYAYLLDRNQHLLYNATRVKSPQNLQNILVTQNISMQRPSRDQVVRIVKVETSPEVVVQGNKGGFFGFLSSQAQAQAQSLK